MKEDRALEILKNAILLEKRGHAFYSHVAAQASAGDVRQFFEMMAEEEVTHISILSDQYKAYKKNKKFAPGSYRADSRLETASRVLTGDLRRQIAAADFEAAAIAAAMSMEKNAIEIYSQRAAESPDAEEKGLYNWLAKWETGHLDFLSRLNKELTEDIWHDNNFWPF